MEIVHLQRFLNENDIPVIKGKPKTFLGIAKQPHYEDVLTNWYAFYFDDSEEHGLKGLFIESLMELLLEQINKEGSLLKDKELIFSNTCRASTQFTTGDRGRLDLLLKSNDSLIIIENKVYHHLNNDLKDYWDTFKVPAKNKIGVVLSLVPVKIINHKHFINITHLQLLQQVYKNIGEYLVNANSKYLMFLNDFKQNIINLSQPLMEENDFNFYFEHQQKINQLIKFKSQIREYIEHEVKSAFYKIENLKLTLYESKGGLGKKLTYYVSDKNKNLMFTIIYSQLMSPNSELKIIIELKNKALSDKEKYRQIVFSDKEKELFLTKFYSSKNKVYEHFAMKTYTLEKSHIKNLSAFIIDKLNNDGFIEIFEKLELVLDEKRSVENQSFQ